MTEKAPERIWQAGFFLNLIVVQNHLPFPFNSYTYSDHFPPNSSHRQTTTPVFTVPDRKNTLKKEAFTLSNNHGQLFFIQRLILTDTETYIHAFPLIRLVLFTKREYHRIISKKAGIQKSAQHHRMPCRTQVIFINCYNQ